MKSMLLVMSSLKFLIFSFELSDRVERDWFIIFYSFYIMFKRITVCSMSSNLRITFTNILKEFISDNALD